MKDFVRPEGEAILLCTHYSLNIVKVKLNFYIFTKVSSSESLCLRNYLVDMKSFGDFMGNENSDFITLSSVVSLLVNQ